MYRMVDIEYQGRKYHLNYSVKVMFAMLERFNNVTEALETIELENINGFKAVKWFFVEMANDGELCRRAMNYDYGHMISMDDISMQISPFDFIKIKQAVVEAIINGYQREHEEDDEIDLGLTEIESKKAQAGV